VRIWRIYDHRARHALQSGFDPLDGRGAALYPGRWNALGVRMVYTSQSPELAMLELLTKLTPATFGRRMAIEIDVPEGTRIEDAGPPMIEHLLRGEDGDTQDFGSAWVAEVRSLLLRVPAAVLPISFNYLVNPLHPEASALEILRHVEVTMDPRFAAPPEQP
jgi:RES domain-containing protein